MQAVAIFNDYFRKILSFQYHYNDVSAYIETRTEIDIEDAIHELDCTLYFVVGVNQFSVNVLFVFTCKIQMSLYKYGFNISHHLRADGHYHKHATQLYVRDTPSTTSTAINNTLFCSILYIYHVRFPTR